MRGGSQEFPKIFPAPFPPISDTLFFWIAGPFFWRTNATPFCRLYAFYHLYFTIYLLYAFYHLHFTMYITAQKNQSVPGGWILWTAFSNILLVLALIFLKFSPACLNTLGLLCLMALVSLRLDVSHTSDPFQFSVISSFPVSFFGEDTSNSYRMLSCMWPIFSRVKAVDCTAAIP